MKKLSFLFAIVLLVLVVYSCRKNNPVVTAPGTVYLDLPLVEYRYFDSTSVSKFIDTLDYKATLGRVLFYDSHLSLNNAISCASCHNQALGFADNVAFSVGWEGRLTKRNSIAISGPSGSLFWDGRESNLRRLAIRPISNHVEMGITDSADLINKLASLPYYPSLFLKAFGNGNINIHRASEAIGIFMESFGISRTKLQDAQFNASGSSLTAIERQGMDLFDNKYNCGSCHNGGNGGYGGFSAGFRDIGLDKVYSDDGFGSFSGKSKDIGTFKVPNLRNVALTAPYMHDGRYKTLRDVLEHYSHNIQDSPNLDTLLKDNGGHAMRMNISEQEKDAIIAFLGTLTTTDLTINPKFSNPFKTK